MMHHHHHTLQRDPNRLGQQTHRMVQNQQRGHPIMLGVPGASPVPPAGRHLRSLQLKTSFLLLLIYMKIAYADKIEPHVYTSDELMNLFGRSGCFVGVLVQVPSAPVPVSAMAPPPTVTVQQHAAPQQHVPPPHMAQHVSLPAPPTHTVQNCGDLESNQPPNEHSVKITSSQQQHTQGGGGNVTPSANVNNTPTGSNVTHGGSASASVIGNAAAATSSASNCLANNKEKTPMCLVNELARYNKITHQYRLTGEQGPAHKKRFTVTLKLGQEEYEAGGASIKKAQHAAASEALKLTKLKHPPPKTNRNVRMGNKAGPGGHLMPTVELNALAMKRGEPTVYLVEVNSHTSYGGAPNTYNHYHRGALYQQNQNRYNNYDPRRNYVPGRGHYNGHFENQRFQNRFWHGESYTVTLRVGPREFKGEGPTAQAARHDAAAKALIELRPLPLPDTAGTCSATSNGTLSDEINTELKSPISLVHEIALKRNLNVRFEVLSEKGPPHMKVFVTVCLVSDLVTEGEGNGKKISKKRAAEKMLEELKKLPPLSPNNMLGVPTRMKRKPNVAKKKTRSLIKAFQGKSDSYSDDLNPISRLIQIQQAKKEKEPIYNLVEERGASRRREFVMEVTVGQLTATGTGPNKKLAKRVAAEELLTLMNYSQTPTQTQDKGSKPPEALEKQRKVTFIDDTKTESQPAGGTGGRQLVPGLILMGDQSNTTFNTAKSSVSLQTTATIAKEFLKAGNSPTAEALAKAGHSQKLIQQHQQAKPSATTQVIRPKDQLLYLSQLLGFQVQFSDFPKANHEEYLTLLSLSTDPPQVCHGAGDTTEKSHDQAALAALRVMSEMGLDTVAPNKKDSQNLSNVEGIHNAKPNIPKASILTNGVKK